MPDTTAIQPVNHYTPEEIEEIEMSLIKEAEKACKKCKKPYCWECVYREWKYRWKN
ncbi:MAG: hypothetical protein IKF39_02165 [Oscillospiraceae bacterium]|nr:hypothetical protein [Oscillospiraceae bacterium]